MADLLATVQELRVNLVAPPGHEGEDQDVASIGSASTESLQELLDGVARDVARRS